MAILNGLKQLLGGATTAIRNVKGAESGLRAALDALAREESFLLSTPAVPSVVEENLPKLIADRGRLWTEAHVMDVVRAASGHIERSSGPAHERPPDRVVEPSLPDVPGVEPWRCALYPDQVFEGLRRVIQEKPYQGGPAVPTRPGRLDAIEEERATLQRRHAELVDEAAAAGVRLEHLPEEISARFNKQRRRAAWEADLRMNREYYERVPSARPPEPE